MTPPHSDGLAPIDDFGAFAAEIGRLLGLDPAGWTPTDLLVDRLRWDSLVALEVVVWLDDRGIRFPEELLGELRALGDIHHYAIRLGEEGRRGPLGRERVPFEGRRVRLTPLSGIHHSDAYELFTTGDHLTRFRLRGATPSPEAFLRVLWDRVLAQFAVLDGRRFVGVVSAYEADLRNRHAHVAVVVRPDAPVGAGVEGLALLVDHLFDEFDLRKVYAEVLEPNAAAFGSGVGSVFAVEGRLRAHEYLGRAYHDMLVLAVTAEEWEVHATRLLGPRASGARRT